MWLRWGVKFDLGIDKENLYKSSKKPKPETFVKACLYKVYSSVFKSWPPGEGLGNNGQGGGQLFTMDYKE